MMINVIPTVDEVKGDDLFQKTVIVVDILRTSSTIITSLANGSGFIYPVETIGQAKMLKDKEKALLAGERYYKKINGFDLGNSPIEYTKEVVDKKAIILSTTNGTRTISKALKGDQVLIGGFLNGLECMKQAISNKRDIVILCAGDKSEFSLEDGLAAGFLIDQAKKLSLEPVTMTDMAMAMYGVYKYYEHNLLDVLATTESGKKLIALGYGEDIIHSSKTNIYSICPYVDHDHKIMIL